MIERPVSTETLSFKILVLELKEEARLAVNDS